MGLLLGILADPVAIVTGAALAIFILDFRPGRIETAIYLLGAFLFIAWGANFQVDWLHGAYSWVWNQEPTYRPGYFTTRYLDDKPAKLLLELTRFAATLAWMETILIGWKGLRRHGA